MQLDADQLAGFVAEFLWTRFDGPQPTPTFHREMWNDVCSQHQYVAFAAPRGHAKSTAITHAMVLAFLLFQERDFALIVSETETQAIQFLNDIKVELKENEKLCETFGVQRFVRDTESDISVVTDHGRFRIIAKGAEQKVRGLKWRGKRPNLIVCDDLEGDEAVMNKERRRKFLSWFYNALLPAGADSCLYRVIGTVLHADSMLERLLNDPSWKSRRYAAHGPGFTNVLWPEKFPVERLQQIRERFSAQGNLSGYSQEYLNQPIDEEAAFYKREWFREMSPKDFDVKKAYYIAADIAVSTKDTGDFTALVVAGVDARNMVYIVDVRTGRWDSLQVIDELFALAKKYEPSEIFIEKGVIERSLGPVFNTEMIARNQFLPITTEHPATDKLTRARSMQLRMKAGGVKFDIDGTWFADLQDEMTRFPRAKHDDQVDAMSLIGLNVDRIYAATTPEEDEEEEFHNHSRESRATQDGRSDVTGY